MQTAFILKRKSDGKYLYVKWYLTTVIAYSFIDNKNEATVFNNPTDQDPLNLSRLRLSGLSFLFLDAGIKPTDLTKESHKPTKELRFDKEDQKKFDKEAAMVERKFPEFFKRTKHNVK